MQRYTSYARATTTKSSQFQTSLRYANSSTISPLASILIKLSIVYSTVKTILQFKPCTGSHKYNANYICIFNKTYFTLGMRDYAALGHCSCTARLGRIITKFCNHCNSRRLIYQSLHPTNCKNKLSGVFSVKTTRRTVFCSLSRIKDFCEFLAMCIS